MYCATFLPVYILENNFNPDKTVQKVGQSPSTVDNYVEEIFYSFNLPIPQQQNLTLEIDNPQKIAEKLHQKFSENNLEVYLSKGEQQVELRIYDITSLRYRIRFVDEEKQQIIPRLKDPEKVKLAIVFSDVGESDITRIIKIDAPINIAIKPYAPFAMRIAKQAAHHWHEVLMDVREIESPTWDVLPFYSGILTHQLLAPPSSFIVQLFPSSFFPLEDSDNLKSAITGIGISARSTLQRGLKKALRDGEAIIVVSSIDPEVSIVLEWIEHNNNESIQLVFLSEIDQRNL